MVTLAAASWGTWSLFLRPTGLSATVTAPIIFLVMGLAALPFTRQLPAARWDRRAVALLLANTAFDALNVLTFFAALNYTTVAIAVLSHYVAPILIALAAPFIDRTRTRGVVPAAAVALAGLVIVLEPWRAPADGAAIGAGLGLISALCYTGNVFCVRGLAVRVGATRGMAYHSLLAAILLSPLLITGAGAVSAGDLGLLAIGAATIGCASGVVFTLGLVRIGSARAAVLTFAEPLVAVAVGVLVWDEVLRPLAVLGGAMVLGAGIHVARKAG
ncbi:MAG: DMT family transporter [Myxococcota bacterium]|nr:DMT family transporter [Myxococcota bacterium]